MKNLHLGFRLSPDDSIDRTPGIADAWRAFGGLGLRSPIVALLASFLGSANAEPFAYADACFIRAEPAAIAQSSSFRSVAAESRLGIRRRTGQLFDVELSVVGPQGALCAVSGVARLREGEVLALPVRAEGAASGKAAATPCLVYVRAAQEAVEITTTEASCHAQSLCGGQVQLHGQRFELATRVPSSGRSQCFARPSP